MMKDWKRGCGSIITKMDILPLKGIILMAKGLEYGGIMMKMEIFKRKRTLVNTVDVIYSFICLTL